MSPGRSDIHHDEPLKFQIPNASFFFHGNPQNPTEKETLILKMNFAKSSHAINTAQKPNTHTSAWKAGEIWTTPANYIDVKVLVVLLQFSCRMWPLGGIGWNVRDLCIILYKCMWIYLQIKSVFLKNELCTLKRKTDQGRLRARAKLSEFWSRVLKAGGTAGSVTLGDQAITQPENF